MSDGDDAVDALALGVDQGDVRPVEGRQVVVVERRPLAELAVRTLRTPAAERGRRRRPPSGRPGSSPAHRPPSAVRSGPSRRGRGRGEPPAGPRPAARGGRRHGERHGSPPAGDGSRSRSRPDVAEHAFVQGHQVIGIEHVKASAARPTQAGGDVVPLGAVQVVAGDDPGRDQRLAVSAAHLTCWRRCMMFDA